MGLYCFSVDWHATPRPGADGAGDDTAGSISVMFVATDWMGVAVETARKVLEELGWSPDAQPMGVSTFALGEIEKYDSLHQSRIQEALADRSSSVTFHCYPKSAPDLPEFEEQSIWILEWEAEHDGDPAVTIPDASSHVTMFLREPTEILRAVQESEERIESRGWITNDWPEFVERIARSELEDRIHPSYLGFALEAFRDGHSTFYMSFASADGYPDREFPLVGPDPVDD